MKMPPAFSSFMRVALKGIMLFFSDRGLTADVPFCGHSSDEVPEGWGIGTRFLFEELVRGEMRERNGALIRDRAELPKKSISYPRTMPQS